MSLLRGDARALPLRDACVQCVVTSPPYFGLRDYGTARWEGGDAACDHVSHNARKDVSAEQLARRAAAYGTGQAEGSKVTPIQYRGICQKCGARRIDRQIGLEPTPDAYVAELVAVFREVRRVLRDDGVVFLNLGDSYNGSGGFAPDAPCNQKRAEGDADAWGKFHPAGMDRMAAKGNAKRIDTLKPKDLIGIPWRVAFALQADGWYLRSDIIWAKPNPIPESVTDRPTKAHEYVFLLTKAARYFWDAEAVAEPSLWAGTYPGNKTTYDAGRPDGLTLRPNREAVADTRNIRSVWTIATQPYPEAHFATFPEALAERCIRAGSRPGDLVLDPFGGSGTVAQVARRLNRRGVCAELNAVYLALAQRRIAEQQVELFEVTA